MNLYKNLLSFFLFAIIAFGSQLAFGQEQKTENKEYQRHIIGLEYSPTFRKSYYTQDQSRYYKGFEVGLSYEYRLNHKLSVLSGLGYYRQQSTHTINGQNRYYTTERIQIPFGFRYYFFSVNSKLQLYTDLVYKIRFSNEEGQGRLQGGEGNISLGASYDLSKRLRISSNIGIGYGGGRGFHLQPKLGLQFKL